MVRTIAIAAIEAALAAVEAERQLINDLNVYPVPDGDTGTNLALTVRAVLDELEQSDAEGIPEVAAAVTKGSLMGARGNSGVILSQVVRGVCEVWGTSGSLDVRSSREALDAGQAAAYRAVKEPVEGTMLTVIREMAAAAQAMPDSLGLETLLAAVDEAGSSAVERTTSQLAALQKAGVVDAGGYGLLVLFRGLATGIEELLRGGGGRPDACASRPSGGGHRGGPQPRGRERALGVPVLHELPGPRRRARRGRLRGLPRPARRQRPRGRRRAHDEGARARRRPRRRALARRRPGRRGRDRHQRHARADAGARRAPRTTPRGTTRRPSSSPWSPARATSSSSASSAAARSSTAASP